ncbi:MAG TPA: hypothetical protein VGJ73_01265 [Verrucomicrobiae bacterium]|jgi:hypothetical protein
MKPIARIASAVAALFVATTLHAQLPFSASDLAAIESTTPLSADELPVIGTFYSLANPSWPGLPANILGYPAWDLGSLGTVEIYLLDDTNGSDSGGGFYAMDDSDPIPPGGGDGGTVNEVTNTYSFPTNGLWLQITNISNGTVYANLNGATDFVYEIYSATNLAVAEMAISNWDIATEVFPGYNTNTMAFSIESDAQPNLFLWARDWTHITSFGNTTPEWWFWEYFGAVDLFDTDLDSIGQHLLLDYQQGIDPNIIFFSFQFPNEIYGDVASGNLVNLSGTPFYEAILINDTNTGDAVWQPYTGTNISVSLNSGNGTYIVSIGLRGRPANATTTWVTMPVSAITSTLALTITGPASGTVSQPMVQLQGLANETLSNLTFDVSNSLGVVTGLQGYWNASFFDTNVLNLPRIPFNVMTCSWQTVQTPSLSMPQG